MWSSRSRFGAVAAFGSLAGALWLIGPSVGAQGCPDQAEQKISATEGGFGGDLDPGDQLGGSVVSLGDLDGDGIGDVAVGAHVDDDGGNAQGAVWILFLNADGTVAAEQKISATSGGFGGDLDPMDRFGWSLAALGDLDGDGVVDLAVGASEDEHAGLHQGAVWILFLNTDGTVASEQKLSENTGGFGGDLDEHDSFGSGVASLGDLNGDGTTDLAVGARRDDDGGTDQGAVWILFLNSNGTVVSEQKISATEGGFGGDLDPGDQLGGSVAALGDLDGDGIGDVAVGAYEDDDGGSGTGAVWILFLNADGTVAAEQKISATSGGFGGLLGVQDFFGHSVASLGDHDGNGIHAVAVGARADNDGGTDQGAVWILSLNADGTVAAEQEISETAGGFGGDLDAHDEFGSSVGSLGDLNGDGTGDLVVGSFLDDDGGTQQGAVWILFLDDPPSVAAGSVSRNGSGSNPVGYVEVTPAVLGTVWSASVDVATPAATASVVAVVAAGPAQVPLGFGEVLIDVTHGFIGDPDVAAGSHALTIPNDCTLVGRTFYTQAATYSPGNLQLQNAIDVTIGTF